MIGKRFRSLPFIFANDNYTLRTFLKTNTTAVSKTVSFPIAQKSLPESEDAGRPRFCCQSGISPVRTA